MKASQFSDAQRAFILKQGADGIPVADISKRSPPSECVTGRTIVSTRIL